MEDSLTEYDNVPFTCYCCRKLIHGFQNYEKHLESSHYKCEICGRAFRTEATKLHHYNIHSVGKGKWNNRRSYIGGTMANSESKELVRIQFQCEFCEEILADIFEWRQHRAETHSMEYIPNAPQEPLPDPLSTLDLVMTKLNVKSQKSYAYLIKCPAENCGFFPATMIYNHINKDHPNSTLRFNCSTCGDIFVSEYDVIEHKAQAHAGSAIDEDEGDVNMEILEGDELLDGTVNISTTEEGGVTVTVQSTQEVLDTVFNHQTPLVQQTGKSNAVFLSKRDNMHSDTNTISLQQIQLDNQPPTTTTSSYSTTTVIPDEDNTPEYITFVEGDQYVEEKNDLQLSLMITKAPINNSNLNRAKKPNLMKGSRGLIKPKSTKVRPDLVGTGSSSMLTVLSPHQQALHQQQVQQQHLTVQHHHSQQPRMIVVSAPENLETHGQTYIIQHEDGTQEIQEIQAKVISDGTVVESAVETDQDLQGEVGEEQTILHVPVGDGQQPTFVIQSQQFQVS